MNFLNVPSFHFGVLFSREKHSLPGLTLDVSSQNKPECKIAHNTLHPNWINPVDAAALGDIHMHILPKAFGTFCIWESTCTRGTAHGLGLFALFKPPGTLLSYWILLVLLLHFKGAFFPFSFGCSLAQKVPDRRWEKSGCSLKCTRWSHPL